ncbi:MAG: cytochrome c oxidase subunit 3 [Candidatus Dormibacteraceae bacterium]
MRDLTRSEYIVPTEREIVARNLWAGARLWSAGMAFLFIAFVFSFYYLRELNIEGQWRPKGTNPPLGFGIAILACIVISAGVLWAGVRVRRTSGPHGAWHLAAGVSLLLGAAGLALICDQFFKAGFRPTGGTYASVFFGWTGFYAATLFGGVFYLETILAKSLRSPAVAAGEIAAGEVEAFSVYWYFLAMVEVLTFILLYIVA